MSELKVGDILLQGVTIYCDKLNDVNGWNWFLYSDIRPYSATGLSGITGLSTNGSAPISYVVENNFKVLSIYNHEIKMEENVPLVVKDNGVVVKLTKTAAKAATASTAGNTEYYTGDDGKYYVNNNGTYEEIAENSWVIPALGYTVTWKNGEKVLETDEHVAAGTVPSYDGDAPTKEGCTFAGWTDGENTYGINDALPEVTGDVTYTAVFTYNDGVGAKVIGHSISLNGDVAVNFYMELAPEIAQSETAYMHFTIPNGTKTTELDVPVSQATVNGNYYVFKCNVAAKDMYATVTARIIDGETLGDEYTYSVKEYADYLLTNADADGTELQQAYAAAAPLVEKMLNYGAYAQKYFAPDTTDDDLANVGHVVDISGVTAETIGKSTYTKELNGVAEFSGATLSLKSQTTLSLYFTSDVDTCLVIRRLSDVESA